MSIRISWGREGIEFGPDPEFEGPIVSSTRPESGPELTLLLHQLEDEGLTEQIAGRIVLHWPEFYRISSSPDHRGSIELLGLPQIEAWRPSLVSRGTLTDVDFSIAIDRWFDPTGRCPTGNVKIIGAVITAENRSSILPEPFGVSWKP